MRPELFPKARGRAKVSPKAQPARVLPKFLRGFDDAKLNTGRQAWSVSVHAFAAPRSRALVTRGRARRHKAHASIQLLISVGPARAGWHGRCPSLSPTGWDGGSIR
jgi:hypothetical protein